MPLAAHEPTLADYRDHLAILRAWVAPIEKWLAGHDDGPNAHAMLVPIGRTPLIDADLYDPAAARPVPTIVETAWPKAPSTAAYRWGVAYVLEGSQLGGAVLYRRLRERLAPHPLRYLDGGSEPVGERWRRFVQAMRSDVTAAPEIADACKGAVDAFDCLISLLTDFSAARGAPMQVDHSPG